MTDPVRTRTEATDPIACLRKAMDDADLPLGFRGDLIGYFCNAWNATLVAAPEAGPWNECALSWCQDRMRCAHPLDGRCEAPEAGKDAEQRDSERVAESLALAPEASEAGKEPSEADVLYVGFDKNMEHRMFRMRATAERHCIGEIKEYVPRGYVQRGCLSVLIPDAAVAVGAKSLHLSYFDKDTRQAALAMLTKAMSWPRDIQQREEG